MNVIRDHIEYIKDNPEGYWFKRKLYGYGWTPAKPAGWLALTVYIAALVGVVVYAEKGGLFEAKPAWVVCALVGLTFLMFLIIHKTGEPPKWQWGLTKDEGQ